ncbi:hypothetical protein KKC94_02855 [Patescibacteria group bacterium]|nr:hypothetical protein [Patescibacteria group bacterium]
MKNSLKIGTLALMAACADSQLEESEEKSVVDTLTTEVTTTQTNSTDKFTETTDIDEGLSAWQELISTLLKNEMNAALRGDYCHEEMQVQDADCLANADEIADKTEDEFIGIAEEEFGPIDWQQIYELDGVDFTIAVAKTWTPYEGQISIDIYPGNLRLWLLNDIGWTYQYAHMDDFPGSRLNSNALLIPSNGVLEVNDVKTITVPYNNFPTGELISTAYTADSLVAYVYYQGDGTSVELRNDPDNTNLDFTRTHAFQQDWEVRLEDFADQMGSENFVPGSNQDAGTWYKVIHVVAR